MSEDSKLKKEFGRKDVHRLRNLMTGKHNEKSGQSVGYSKSQSFYKEGDIWEEDGRKWTIKEGIRNIVKNPVQRMIKYEFLKFILEDRLWIVKNPEYWLKDTFFHLDAYASMTHN